MVHRANVSAGVSGDYDPVADVFRIANGEVWSVATAAEKAARKHGPACWAECVHDPVEHRERDYTRLARRLLAMREEARGIAPDPA